MKLGIFVMHCPPIPGRPEAFRTLWHQLGGDFDRGYPLHGIAGGVPWVARVVRDNDRRGAWHTARACWEEAVSSGVDYAIVLNDDAALPRGFVEAALRALQRAHARAPGAPVCFYTAHPRAPEADAAGCAFYSTPDGLVGVGCGMHRDAVVDFLAWHDRSFVGEHTDDGRINLWAMATKRRVLTTVPSLVGHQLPGESTVGNTNGAFREPNVPPPADVHALQFEGLVARFGRQYRGNHWRLLTNVGPWDWKPKGLIEEAYRLEREVDEAPYETRMGTCTQYQARPPSAEEWAALQRAVGRPIAPADDEAPPTVKP